jgi:hypothetical protein
MLAEQLGKEPLALPPAHQAEFQRTQPRQGAFDRGGLDRLEGRHPSMRNRVVGRLVPHGRQLNQPGAVQTQHQAP